MYGIFKQGIDIYPYIKIQEVKKVKKRMIGALMAVALVTTGLVMPIMNENIVYADTEFTDGSKALKEEDSESSVFSDDTEADSDVDEKNNFSSEIGQDTVPVAGVNDGCALNQSYNIVNLRQREFGRDIYYYYSADIPNDGRIRIILEDCNEKIMDNRYFYYSGSFDKEQRLYRWWDIGTDTYDSGWITVHAGKISGELINGEYNNDVNKEAKIIIKYESQDEYQGEKELNDTYDTANIIQPNTIYEGGCTNRVWGPIDVDMYKFYMEQSGLAVIDMKNLLGGDSATEFEVYEEDEHENVYLLTKATNRKRLRLPAGVYYIKESTTMQYSLKLDINYESPEEYEQENNNVRSLANEKQINTWYTGNLNTGKDIDFYKFELKKSGNANVELKVPRQSSSNAVVATLYDKDMNELDKISNNENPYATTEQKKYPAGIYYVTVKSPYSGGFEPDYSICFSQEKYKYVKQITLPENLKINTGERYTLKPQILPSDAENQKLIWSSSDNNVVTVNSNGVVTGKGDGTAVITAKATDGSGVECSTTIYVKTVKKDIQKLDVVLDASYTYTGKSIKPNLDITDGKKILVKDVDYTISYKKNIGIGTALITVTGIGNYTGVTEESFDIVPRNITINSVKTAGKGKLKISWKKASGIDGYVLYRSTSQDGNYKRIKTIKNPKTVNYTDSSLKKGKKYYYKVDAYKKVDDGTIFYSLNSKPKGAKTSGATQKVNVVGTYRGNATITVYKKDGVYYAKAYGRGGRMNTTVRLYSYSGGYKAYYNGNNSDVFFTISNISSKSAKITFPYVSEFTGWYSR